MAFREEWETSHKDRGSAFSGAGMGALRVALLFGSAAVALALVATPFIESQAERIAYSSYTAGYPAGIDMMATGAVGQRGSGTYTVRRSVLQPSPNSVCIIRSNGMRTGDC